MKAFINITCFVSDYIMRVEDGIGKWVDGITGQIHAWVAFVIRICVLKKNLKRMGKTKTSSIPQPVKLQLSLFDYFA